jgi:DNA-directed RNA polymerase specialized sigma24 family protein
MAAVRQAHARISVSAESDRIVYPGIFNRRKAAAEMHCTGRMQQQLKTEDPKRAAVDLYWLAFLLTGRRDISIDIAADAAASGDHANPFFADWMRGWQRRLVIAKALAAIHGELADSVRRTEIAQASRSGMPRNWSLSPETNKADLERALLAIGLFPRAALLLLVFEGVRIADAATLLDAKPELLKKAQVIGLRELTANLAAAPGADTTSTRTDSSAPAGPPAIDAPLANR